MQATKTTGLMIAVAAAAMFAAGAIVSMPAAAGEGVKCMGANSCKGHSACKTAASSCAGQNACKGQGWIKTDSAEACAKAGGKPA